MRTIIASRMLVGAVVISAAAYAGCSSAGTGEAVNATQTGLGDDGEGREAGRREGRIRNQEKFNDPAGQVATYSTRDGKYLDTNNAFFKSLGTNGRRCVDCHEAQSGFSVSAARAQERYEESDGEDPLFRTNDGTVNPNADVSTPEAKRAAYKLLLEKGLIRIELPIPPDAQFELVGVDDPYGNDTAGNTKISVFRRPLASTNLKFVNPIMWDGREPSLASQARNATLRHAQGTTPIDDATANSIVDFETALFTTQVVDFAAGNLSAAGAFGNPKALSLVPFVDRENSCNPAVDPGAIVHIDGSPCPVTHTVTDPHIFHDFDAWANKDDEKAAIARGQEIFATKAFFDPNAHVNVSCANCHNHPESGAFTIKSPGPPFGGFPTVQVSNPAFNTDHYLPVYTFHPKSAPPGVGLVQTTDPGKAMTTGLMRDMNRFKVTMLRGLASHAPYFHNGMAATLGDVVDHYDRVFHIGYTAQERSDLIAFLNAL